MNRKTDASGHNCTVECRCFKEFASNTSLHGIKYIGDTKRSLTERIWWIIMVFLSFCVCSYLIFQVWIKWEENPVIVSFSQHSTPVWKIPFPAVTICPLATTLKSKFDYGSICDKENNTQDDLDRYDMIADFCRHNCLNSTTKVVKESVYAQYKYMAYDIKDVIFACDWVDSGQRCLDYFSPILTEQGMCFTTNMLNWDDLYTENAFHDSYYLNNNKKSEGWTPENGYPNHLPFNTFPTRAKGIGLHASLNMILRNPRNNTDFKCNGIYKGFKIAIHPPHILPSISREFLWAPFGFESVISVKPKMMTTSRALRKYDPNRRKCFWSHERYLKYFKIYSRSSCELECLTNYTAAVCGCVTAIMPRDNSTPICAIGSMECVNDVSQRFTVLELEFDLQDKIGDNVAHMNAMKCNCLSACSSLKYEFTTTQTKLDWDSKVDLEVYEVFEGYDTSILMIHFNEPYIIGYQRSELFGMVDFLANCGGLLGVCLGFSILSFVEIIYFCGFKLFCHKKIIKIDEDKSENVEYLQFSKSTSV